MTAWVILALVTGAALGAVLMGMVAGGRREDECRACKRAAFREPGGCDRVEGHSSAPRDAVADARGACPQPDGSR